MSFRELRNFTEIMKTLGYPRLISMENFRTPNFELVADILFWLVNRYDPTLSVSDDISTEDHRVRFLKKVAQVMHTKAQVRLNIKKLYRADGYAVKELLKIASVLYRAVLDVRQNRRPKPAAGAPSGGSQLSELKEARNLGTEIVQCGARLHQLLESEVGLKQSRSAAVRFLDEIAFNLESDDPHRALEKAIQGKIIALSDDVVMKTEGIQNLHQDREVLTKKISRKRNDLERTQKRLRGLRKVRPAYMDEFEELEKELKQVYGSYVEKFRNLSYVKKELSELHKRDEERKAESNRVLKRMQKRLRAAELKILRGEDVDDDAFNNLFANDKMDRQLSGSSRNSIRTDDDVSDLLSSDSPTPSDSRKLSSRTSPTKGDRQDIGSPSIRSPSMGGSMHSGSVRGRMNGGSSRSDSSTPMSGTGSGTITDASSPLRGDGGGGGDLDSSGSMSGGF